MEFTKFNELCFAYGKAQEDFEAFQSNCHQLSIELVQKLKIYFELPESQFSLYKINAENDFELVTPSLINALTLMNDSYWHFGIGITVCIAPETLPQELILIRILVRKDMENKFFVKHGEDIREFEIIKDDLSTFHRFFDYLHKNIVKSYEEQLQQFIGQSTRRKLGFKY